MFIAFQLPTNGMIFPWTLMAVGLYGPQGLKYILTKYLIVLIQLGKRETLFKRLFQE